MELKKVNVADIIENEKNPRILPEKNRAGLKFSIDEFGYVEPIILNRNMHLISGHQRLGILINKGYKEIQAIIVDIPEDKENLLNVTLNNHNIRGLYDAEKLDIVIKEILERKENELKIECLNLDNFF